MASAQPWVDHDPAAREAARLAEERLGVLHPELIDRYQQRLADGLNPIDAMVVATVVLTPTPGDINAAAAAQAIAGNERDEALHDAAALAATVSVDEHTRGILAGAAHAAVSDAASARAARLAAQAFPQALRGTLGRGGSNQARRTVMKCIAGAADESRNAPPSGRPIASCVIGPIRSERRLERS